MKTEKSIMLKDLTGVMMEEVLNVEELMSVKGGFTSQQEEVVAKCNSSAITTKCVSHA